MQSCLHPAVERARPFLGAVVSIRVEGLSPDAAALAVEKAFAAIRAVHEGMSFHREDSELSQLNRRAHRAPVRVSDDLWRVLRFSGRLFRETSGAFDVTVAPQLVRAGLLPPPSFEEPPSGTWADVALLPGKAVFFRRPLWIDLGGIAKGYAVDRGAEVLSAARAAGAVINAGGDLRIVGRGTHGVVLRVDHATEERTLPVLEISSGSVASSCSTGASGIHVNGRNRKALRAGIFVSVAAKTCMAADGLTKAVMADPAGSRRALRRMRAQAYVHEEQVGWSHWT